MNLQKGLRFQSFVEFWDYLPEEERIITDVLRQIILEHLPEYCTEKLTFNVPFYYGRKRICLIWPASVPAGGIKEGVLLGFCQGFRLSDPHHYLSHGTNKRVYYKIIRSPEEIEERIIVELLQEAVQLDKQK